MLQTMISKDVLDFRDFSIFKDPLAFASHYQYLPPGAWQEHREQLGGQHLGAPACSKGPHPGGRSTHRPAGWSGCELDQGGGEELLGSMSALVLGCFLLVAQMGRDIVFSWK